MWPLPGLAPATRQASPPGTAGSREWGLLSALFPVGLGTQNNHCPVPSRGSVNLWLLPQDVREQGSKRSVEWTLACPGRGLGPCRRGRGVGVGALHRETLASAKRLPRGSYSSCAAIDLQRSRPINVMDREAGPCTGSAALMKRQASVRIPAPPLPSPPPLGLSLPQPLHL